MGTGSSSRSIIALNSGGGGGSSPVSSVTPSLHSTANSSSTGGAARTGRPSTGGFLARALGAVWKGGSKDERLALLESDVGAYRRAVDILRDMLVSDDICVCVSGYIVVGCLE